jgi:CubicO group peptidase (beta-lactamase class C family)
MRYVLILALAAWPLAAQLLPQAAPEQLGLSEERIARIKPVQETYVAQHQLAGGTMLIARRGKVAYFDTFGNMPKDAIFRIYSMTKPIIATAALTLYEEGKYSLLDPVSKYLPEFARMKVFSANGALVPAERPITVMDLMRHTSGMNNQGPRDEKGELIFPKLAIQSHDLAEGVRLLASAPLVHQPGTGFDYSPGPDVVGRLIEVWSGKPLDVFLEERIFKPLHMPDTGFFVPEAKWSRIATLYDAGPNGEILKATDAEQDGYRTKPVFLSGAGGLASTTTDYLRFAQMLLNGGELDGARILSPKTVDLMHADLLGSLPIYGGPMLPGYGFGLTVAVNRGPAMTASVGTAGEYYWEGAAASLFFVDPKEQIVAVYMIQKRRGIAISREFKRMVYQTILQEEK